MTPHCRQPPPTTPSADRLTGATPPTHRCNTGPYHYESSISSSSSTLDGIPVVEVETAALAVARRRRSGRFLKGPIPLGDIAAAARLPGAALPVFLAVHHRVALTREKRVRLPRALMEQFGINRAGKARALRRLEAAGLIEVERRTGRSVVVKLVTATTPSKGEKV